MSIKIGSRKSHLAQVQARAFNKIYKEKFPQEDTELFFKPSFGDLNLDMDLSKTDNKGVFTSDFFELLKTKDCDLVVHSWKDLPIDDNGVTQITATLDREDTRDLFFLKREARSKSDWSVLTSSPRREFNLSEFFTYLSDGEQTLSYLPIRGNIPTRFTKFLEDENADGFCVAAAAVKRLIRDKTFNEDNPGVWERISKECHWAVLPASYCPSAAAQGALAVETLVSNDELNAKLAQLNNEAVMDSVNKERAILKNYGGGCHLAVGANVIKNKFGELTLKAGFIKGDKFRDLNFKPFKSYPDRIEKSKVWISTEEAKATRTKRDYKLSDTDVKSLMVTRFESYNENVVSDLDLVHSAGLRTWKKLYKNGQWVNSCLDSLGVDLYVGDLLEQGVKDYWLTRDDVKGPEGFETVETYDLEVELDEDSFEGKDYFLWMSGELMVKSIEFNKDLRSKKHFIGMGRSSEMVESFMKENAELLEEGFEVFPIHSLEQFKKDLIKE